jgi:hypothetical protein
MEGHCSTGQSPQWAVVPMEEKEERRYLALLGVNYCPPLQDRNTRTRIL